MEIGHAFDGVAYYASRISPHRGKTHEGYLIATGIPIARTGWQTYKASELGIEGEDGDKLIQVYRDAKDVFDPITISSFEGKTVTSPHPGMFLSPDNDNAYNRGHVQNVRRGERLPDGEFSLIADLHIKDANLISQIESGQLDEVSCGYKYALEAIPDEHSPEVRYAMRELRGNHVAIVPRGRAGSDVRVLDANPIEKEGGNVKEELQAVGEFFKGLGLRLTAQDAEPDPVKNGREAAERGEERSMKRNEDAEAELAKLKAKDAEEEKEKAKKESEDRKARDARVDKTLDCMDKFMKDAEEKEKVKAKDAEEEKKKEEAKKAADAEEEKKKAADAGKCNCDAKDGEPHDKDCPAYKAEDAELIPVETFTGNEIPQNPIPGADKALDALRAIKPLIAKSGDNKAIQDWNAAYRALKPGGSNDGKYAHIVNNTRKPEGVEGVMDGDNLAKAAADFEHMTKQGFRQPIGTVKFEHLKEAN